MEKAKEIIRDIKLKIRFQSANDEECAHYTLIGNTLVRIATNSASIDIMKSHFGEKFEHLNIISIVFSNKVEEKKEKLPFAEYVFNPELVTNNDVNFLIRFFQKLTSGEVWTTSI